MREVHVSLLTAAVAEMCREANYYLGADIISALQKGLEEEISPAGKAVFRELLENARIAGKKIPSARYRFCRSLREMGQNFILWGDFNEAIHEGVRQGYLGGFLRKSIIKDPLRRENTGDNTPAVIHLEIVPGDKLKLIFVPKGGGSENMSAVKMLTPSLGKEGLMDFVVETVAGAGASACPPMVVGVGLGGTLEKVAYLAKKALLRPLGQQHHDPFYAAGMELLEKKRTGIGPQGPAAFDALWRISRPFLLYCEHAGK